MNTIASKQQMQKIFSGMENGNPGPLGDVMAENMEWRWIKIYKTDVTDQNEAAAITKLLIREFPSGIVSFDLEDCDNVLRIESSNGSIDEQKVRDIFGQFKREIETLPL